WTTIKCQVTFRDAWRFLFWKRRGNTGGRHRMMQQQFGNSTGWAKRAQTSSSSPGLPSGGSTTTKGFTNTCARIFLASCRTSAWSSLICECKHACRSDFDCGHEPKHARVFFSDCLRVGHASEWDFDGHTDVKSAGSSPRAGPSDYVTSS